jgi:hypothetical protein
MKKLTLIILVIFAIFTISSCAPNLEDLIVGTWVNSDPESEMGMGKLVMMKDGSIEVYNDHDDDPDTDMIVTEKGTWSIEGNIVTINFTELYDDITEQLEPVEDGDQEKVISSFVVNKEKLAIAVGLTENGNKDTLVGTWESTIKIYEKGETEPEDMSTELVLNDDDTFTMAPFMGDADGISGTWEYTAPTLTLTDDETSEELECEIEFLEGAMLLTMKIDMGGGNIVEFPLMGMFVLERETE